MTINKIRSFVRRGERVTAGQQHALNTLWSQYVIDYQAQFLDLDAIFNRNSEKHIEIGFGMGDALINMAKHHPENDYLGIEVYRSGVGRVLMQIEKEQLTNVRVMCADCVDIIDNCLPSYAIDAVYIFFPDPWHKNRHHKRRLIQPIFINALVSKMKNGAYLHLATDWGDYAQQMLQVLEENQQIKNDVGIACFAPRLSERPLTKFERRGQRLGHSVWDLRYIVSRLRGNDDLSRA